MSRTWRAALSARAQGSIDRGGARILGAVTGGHALSHFLYQGFLVMLPAVRDALSIGPVEVGAIMTAREMASGLASLPGGVLCDRLRRYWGLVLAACMAAFGVGWVLVSVSSTYFLLVTGMVVLSVASAIWHLPAMAALSHRFANRRGTALSIHGVGGAIGDVFGPVVTGFLLAYVAWRGLLATYAVVPILVGVAGIWVFRGLYRSEQDDGSDHDGGIRLEEIKRMLRNATLWRVNLVSALRGMCYQVYTTFLPLFLADELGFDSKGVGLHLGLMFTVSIVASPAMGYLSDRLGRKTVLVPMLLGLAALTVALALWGRGSGLTIIIVLLGFFLRSDYSLLSAAVLDIAGRGVATTTLGVISSTRFLLGGISPLIGGILYEKWGMEVALYYVAALYAVAAILLATTRLQATE